MASLKTIANLATLGVVGTVIKKQVADASRVNAPQLPPAPDQDAYNLAAAKAANIAQTRARALASGQGTHGGTLLTGPSGLLTPAPTAPKSLLGL